MKLQSKFMGFALVVCIVFGFVGCGSSSGAPKCESGEVKKAFLSRPNVKKTLKDIEGSKFVDFKTISHNKELGIVNCQCSLKTHLGIDAINFSAERLENGKIAIDIEGWLSWESY